MKSQTAKDTNVKHFMQTEEYNRLRSELNWQINNNSQSFNLKVPQPSNLLAPKELGGGKTEVEIKAIKLAKKEFKLDPDNGRDDVVKTLVNAPVPNWNVRFRERGKIN